jgi:hypothetical protein
MTLFYPQKNESVMIIGSRFPYEKSMFFLVGWSSMFGMKLMSSNFRFLRFGSSHRSRNGKQEEWGSVASVDGVVSAKMDTFFQPLVGGIPFRDQQGVVNQQLMKTKLGNKLINGRSPGS